MIVPWVLVIFNPETEEVKVRGPWEEPEDAVKAAKAFSEGRTSEADPALYRLAVVGVTPMVWFQPETDNIVLGEN